MDILNKIQEGAHTKSLQGKSAVQQTQTKGRILRLKQGYNPNSSSMGSIVFSLPQIMLGFTALFGIVSGFILTKKLKKHPAGTLNTKKKATQIKP